MLGTTICPRCGHQTSTTIMSMFNTEEICIDCKKRERNHPLYPEACRQEEAAVQAGNYNFSGIGCPADLYLTGG